MNLKTLLFGAALAAMSIVGCAKIEELVGRNNADDDGGSNWLHDQAPVVTVDTAGFKPQWSSFSHKDSTGSIVLPLSVYDPNAGDTVQLLCNLSLGLDGSGFIAYAVRRIDSTKVIVDGIHFGPDSLVCVLFAQSVHTGTVSAELNVADTTVQFTFTLPAGMPPRPPRALAARADSSGVHLSWNADSSDSVTIFRSRSRTGIWTQRYAGSMDGDTAGLWVDSTVVSGQYWYAIQAYGEWGRAAGDTVSAFASVVDTTLPVTYPYTNNYADSISVYVYNYPGLSAGDSVVEWQFWRSRSGLDTGDIVGIVPVTGSSYYTYFRDTTVTGTDAYLYRVSYTTKSGKTSRVGTSASGNLVRLSAVSGFSVGGSGVYGRAIGMSWNSLSGALGYLVYRYVYGATDADTVLVDTVPYTIVGEAAPHFIDSTITADTTYAYYIRAFNSKGAGDPCSYGTGRPLRSPFALAQDTSGYTDTSIITVRWQTANSYYYSPIDTAILYRSVDDGVFEPLDTVALNNNYMMYADTVGSSSPATRYQYYVTEYRNSDSGESFPSDTITANTAPTTGPDTVFVEAHADSVVLSWHPVFGASGYLLYVGPSYPSNTGSEFVLVDTVQDTSAVIDTLLDTTRYWYVRAVNGSVAAPWYGSAVRSVAVHGLLKPELNTSSPATSANSTAEGVVVSWSAMPNAAGYILSRAINAAGVGEEQLDTVADTLSWLDTSANALPSMYRVRGINEIGVSDSATEWSPFANRTAPAAPDSLVASRGTAADPATVDLVWHHALGADYYRVYRAVLTPASGIGVYTLVDSTADTLWADSGLVDDSVYAYALRSVNVAASSASLSAAAAGFRRPAAAPDTALAVTASQNQAGQITLAWALPTSGAPVSSFVVYRSDADGGTPSPIDTVLYDYGTMMNTFSIVDVDVLNASYWYVVRPANVVGENTTLVAATPGARLQ